MNAILYECQKALASPNVLAFLRLIRAGESSQVDEAYRTVVGGGRFIEFDDHPRRSVHIASLGVNSTAAGAYQFLSKTWDACVKALELPDFSPVMQDVAAIYLIRGRGALSDVLAGNIPEAIAKCAREWASLPGSPYGQPTRTLEQALATYAQWGGKPTGATPAPAPIPAQPIDTSSPPVDQSPESGHIPTVRNPRTVAGEAPDWSTGDNPSPVAASPENDMPAPLIAAAVSAIAPDLLRGLGNTLINIFSPVAKAKVEKELARHGVGSSEADQIFTAAVDAAKTVTGLSDPVQATAAVTQNPTVVPQVEADTMDTLERLMPLLDKLNGWEAQALKDSDASRDAAAQRATLVQGDRLFIDSAWIKLSFIEILSLLFVFISAGGALALALAKVLDEQMLGAIVTLMLIAGYTGVREFWLGGSRGSAAKDVTISELSRRKP